MRTLLCLMAILLTAPALAWDASLLADVRFSPDGRYFSFVEYGEVLDVEDEAYASMYVVDIARDEWVAGTPLRVALSGSGATEANALRAIRRKGAQVAAGYGLQDAGKASVAYVDVDRGDPYRRRRAVRVPALGSAKLELHERRASSAHGCREDYHVPADFRLVLSGAAKPLVLAEYRGGLPRSRGCATEYDIAAVYVHRAGGQAVVAALVGVYTPGWEGSDRRLIAVTGLLP